MEFGGEQNHSMPPGEPMSTRVEDAPKENNNKEMIQFSEHKESSHGVLLCWLAAIFSILAGGLFWWINTSNQDILAEKKSEKDAIIQELSSPSNAAIEKKANDFRSSVTALENAANDHYSYTIFLQEFNKKITNDVQLSSISVSQDGGISFNGKTGSYRKVADLMMALNSFTSLSEVELSSVALSQNEGAAPEVVFGMSAKLKKETTSTVSAESTSSTAGSAITSDTAASAPSVTGGAQ